MADITVTIPDEYWPRVAAAFHATYPDNTETPDVDLIQIALKSLIRDVWVSVEQSANQNAAVPRYNQTVQDYNAARQVVDADVQTENAQVLADSQDAFPGI
jgi:hypothetical protein